MDEAEHNEVKDIVKKYQMTVGSAECEVIRIAQQYGRVSRRLRVRAGLSEEKVKAAFAALRKKLDGYGTN